MTEQPVCPINACKTCMRCFREDHAACTGTVTCPSTGEVITCRCCGKQAAS